MARICPYRREVSEACNWHQDQALNSTIFILHQTGPTGFLLKEEGEHKNFKVFLGDVHNCTCPVFKKEKDLCKHVCWVLLKKFRVLRTDPLSWQLGLNEREINGIIRGDSAQEQQRTRIKPVAKKTDQNDPASSNEIEQRPITALDVCPICQDEFLTKKLPVSYCRFGCGNNVHIKCMKVWADHQKTNGETTLKCPLCRETFCSFDLLDQEYRNNGLFKTEKQDLHYGLICKSCNSTPISGKCYKCTMCNEFYLCQPCFNTDFHKDHSFVFREKINQKYHKATRDHVGIIPYAVAQNLAQRELNEADYDLLLQLDSGNNAGANISPSKEIQNFSQIPEKIIKSWPMERVRENSLLLNPGYQCRICLRPYLVNQVIRKLPNCKHKFHLECADNWLLHSHPTCPIDGQVVWDPVAIQMEKEEKKNINNNNSNKINKPNNIHKSGELEVPGLGLIINYKSCIVDDKASKNAIIDSSTQNKIVKNKKIPSKSTKPQSSPLLSSEKTLSSGLSKNNFKIEVEGRNLSATTIFENIEDYTNALAATHAGSTISQNILETTHSNKFIHGKPFFNKLQQIPKSIPTPNKNNTQFPLIQVKGHNFDNQLNDNRNFGDSMLNTDNNLQSNNNLLKKQISFNDLDLFRRRNSDADIPFKDAFNVSTMLNSKPYQLSRLSNKKSTSSGVSLSNDKQSDFYIYEDESDAYSEVPLPPPANIKNDLFLYSPPNNSFALSNSIFYKENIAENNPNNNSNNNNQNNFENESMSVLENSQHSSNHLLFNNDLTIDQATNSIMPNKSADSGNKKALNKNASLKKFNYHHIRHPPVMKKAFRNSNSDLSIDEIQANLPSVLIINSNPNASVSTKAKCEETNGIVNVSSQKSILKKPEKLQEN